MKLRLAGTVKRLNVEHRTSNIDDATLYLILKQANRSLRRTQPNRISKDRFALLSLFLIDRIHYSMLDVQCSMLMDS